MTSGSPFDSPLEHAQLEGERDEPLLRAVVEIALEKLPLTLRRLDDARAGAAELLEPGPQLGVEPGVLERDPGGGLHPFEQLGLVVERRVVDQGCDVDAVPVDERRRAAFEVRKLDRLPVEVDVDAEIGQPVRELQRGIAQGAGE